MLKTFSIPVLALTALVAGGCGADSRDTTDGGAHGSLAGSDAAGADAGSDGDGSVPVCNLDTFCPVYLAYCDTTIPGYTTMAECTATFAALGVANPYKQQCQSYHLCNAIFDTGDDRVLHCSHAAGGGDVCGF